MATPEVPELPLPHVGSGKVREIYELDDNHLVFVTTDRISAYDWKMHEPIPNKGRVLTSMTEFWFDRVGDLVEIESADLDSDKVPSELQHPYYQGRTQVVKKAEMLPIECIVRGHLTGSAWAEYKKSGTVHGEPAPKGLMESEAFPEPIFTPSTKAEQGKHDENLSFEQAVELVGDRQLLNRVRDICLQIFDMQARRSARRGIIMADTKYEIGLIGKVPVLCDEVGTPDSSRFWPADLWVPGQTPPSYDKQYLRDYLTGQGWDRKSPPPHLPEDVVSMTARKYQQASELITELPLATWPGIHVELPAA